MKPHEEPFMSWTEFRRLDRISRRGEVLRLITAYLTGITVGLLIAQFLNYNVSN